MARESRRIRNERRYGRPERMADSVFANQWKLPFWMRDCVDDEFRSTAFEIRKTFLETMRETTVVVADNVAEFFYAETPKEIWRIEDFPCCAPPRDVLFIEMKRPSRIFSEGIIKSPLGIPELTGLLITYKTRNEIISSWDAEENRQDRIKNIERFLRSFEAKIDLNAITKAREEGMEAIGKLSAMEQSFLVAATQYMAMKSGMKAADHFPEDLEWSMHVEVVVGDNNNICYLGSLAYKVAKNGILMDRPQFSLLGNHKVDDAEAKLAIRILEQSADPGLLALSFMHCKNIVLESNDPDRHLNNERRKAGLKPFVRYHTINIEPMKKVLKTEGNSEIEGLKRALHICRGHFSTYSEEKPLFGRVAGTFWIPSHVRGSIKEGVVVSDYKVNPAAKNGEAKP